MRRGYFRNEQSGSGRSAGSVCASGRQVLSGGGLIRRPESESCFGEIVLKTEARRWKYTLLQTGVGCRLSGTWECERREIQVERKTCRTGKYRRIRKNISDR